MTAHRTAAIKKTVHHKTSADKTEAEAAKTVDEKKAAPAKKRVSRPVVAAPVASPLAELSSTPTIPPEERHHLIEITAYYIAERRGFGHLDNLSCDNDWLQAEQEIDALIATGKLSA